LFIYFYDKEIHMITLVQLEQDIKDEVAKLEKLVGDDLAYLKAKLITVFAHPTVVGAASTPIPEITPDQVASPVPAPAPTTVAPGV
jgi:hypothetical protein